MKLYGTITSERATKGQGGNKFLIFEVTQQLDKNKYESIYFVKFEVIDGEIKITTGHVLTIKSLHEAMADCSCGWHYVFTGEMTREQITVEYNKHIGKKQKTT